MKKIILIMIFCLAFYSNIRADCSISTDCENEQFPYKFCNSEDNTIVMCCSNPNNQGSLIPFKNIPCFIYDPNSFTIIYKQVNKDTIVVIKHDSAFYDDDDIDQDYPYYGIYDSTITIYKPGTKIPIKDITTMAGLEPYEDGDEIIEPYDTWKDTIITQYDTCNNFLTIDGKTVFDFSSVQSCVNNALSAWTNCCKECDLNNTNIQYCCDSISWTRDRRKFQSSDSSQGTPRTTWGVFYYSSPNNCQYDCSKDHIYLNQTNNYIYDTDEDVTVYDPCIDDYTRWYITGKDAYWMWPSLTAIIMHEMGHAFGFGEEYIGTGKDCATDSSIMNTKKSRYNPNCGLSADDICMYKKLYCPGATDIKETKATEIAIKVFPNPTNNNLLNLHISNPYFYQMNYEIYSPIGISVISGNILPNENTKTINLEGLPKGVFIILLKYSNEQKIEKFVINK